MKIKIETRWRMGQRPWAMNKFGVFRVTIESVEVINKHEYYYRCNIPDDCLHSFEIIPEERLFVSKRQAQQAFAKTFQ